MTLDLQRDIAARLTHRRDTRSIGPVLLACRTGGCDKCGDVCPIKAGRWVASNTPAIERALVTGQGVPVWKVMITRDRWVRAPDDLAHVSVGAIEKAIRRSLDALRQPSTIAVGIIDAWLGWRRWEVGAILLIAGPSKSELFDTFPLSAMQIDEVTDLGPAVADLFRSGHTPKRMPPFDADGELPGTKRRGEYYSWLAGLTPGSRIFRYGCDRYFNPLQKQSHWKPTIKKGHPRPRWLEPYQYGTHGMMCDCWICQRQRH